MKPVRRAVLPAACLMAVALLVAGDWASAANDAAPHAQVTELLRQPDPDNANREIVVARVDFPPGAASQPHRHPGLVMGYVLAGEFDFQIEGQPLQHFRAGDRFYEPPHATHAVSRNPSQTNATQVLVFMLLPKGQPLTVPIR